MAPSTIYKLSLLCSVLSCTLSMAALVSGADVISCWLVEDISGTPTKPRHIQQTPVMFLLKDVTGLTPEPVVSAEPGTLVYYVTDQSGQLRSRDFSSCEMTHHLPQEVNLEWTHSLTEEHISPPSIGRTWFTVSLSAEADRYSVSSVLGPQGEKDDHLTVFLAVYTPLDSMLATLNKPVTLPCGFWRGQQSRFSVEWRHRALGEGKVLYAYDGRLDRIKEDTQGFSMNFTALHSFGDAALKVENTDVLQQGTFLCTIYLPYVRAQRDLKLQVTARPQVALLPDPLFARPDEELTLSCDVSHFHPLEVSVEFLVRLPDAPHSTLLPGTVLSTQTRNHDGTYSLTATQRIKAKAEHHGARYSCHVQHITTPDGVTRSHTLHVAGVSGLSLEDGMYLFFTSLFLYGFFSLLGKKVGLLGSSNPIPQDKGEKGN